MRPTVDAVVEQATGEPQAVDLGEYSFMKEGGSELAPINTDIVGGVPEELVAQVEEKEQAILDGSFTTPVDESAPAGSIDVSKL
jgi:basic membrane lipoprotein Med (substrate-binding protein (PBP1-ABC) superfamily)